MSSILPQNHPIRSSQCVISRTSDKIRTIQRRSLHQVKRNSHYISLPARVYCVSTPTTTTIITKPPGLNEPQKNDINGIHITTTTTLKSVLNDPSLQSTWTHRAWLASGCTTVLISLDRSMTSSWPDELIGPVIAGYVGYILADLASGIYHWGIDNYGGASTPVFGSQIEAFQGHHKYPWTITKRQFANNLHALARAVTFSVLPIDLLSANATLHGFVAIFSGCIMFSQQFHAWAHGTKSKLPPPVVALQDAGILVSRPEHNAHHRPPYNNNYCIVSGVWNRFLDETRVFEVLEMVIFFKFGVRPRSWSEPDKEWIEDTEMQISH